MLCLLSALSLCPWCVVFEYGSISRFKGVLEGFGRFVWVCVACVLCLACGALYAWIVRRIYGLLRVCLPFCLLCSCFSSSLPFVFPCLSSGCPVLVILPILSICFVFVGLWVCCWVFFFPCGLYAKRKGAKVLPCVLACLVVGCFIWLLLCIPRTRQVSARLYRNKVLEKGNLIECSKLFCARLCSYLCSSKFVFLLFSYLFPLVGSYFLFPFGLYV